jgi:paraquat-inducible protein A
MLSAMSFDPRLIWDEKQQAPHNEEVTDEATSH